jgi:6-phosphogluconolactonase (cycloisomerase 2 family)
MNNPTMQPGEGGGAVYFMTNTTEGKNEIIMAQRAAAGSLRLVGAFATGGSGAGKGPEPPFADPLGSQDSLVMNKEHTLLFAVNAGSNDISVFQIQPDGLSLCSKVNAGGNFPVSLALHSDLLYVLNAGGDGAIMGFAVQPDGRLMPLGDSRRSLGIGGTEPPYVFQAPGQIAFTPNGRQLVVVEKGIRTEDHTTHKLHVFTVDEQGMPSATPTTTVANGLLPFAATFTPQGHLLVVEVFGQGPILKGTGGVSSYAVRPDGSLRLITGSVATYQRESCWIRASGNYAYVTNFGTHSITGYQVGANGSLHLLNADGVTAMTGDGSHPVDFAITPDGHLLYVLLPGTSQVGIYGINPGGSLTRLGAFQGEWPIGSQGMVAI